MKSNISLYQPQFPNKEWYGTARDFTEQIDQKYLAKPVDLTKKRQNLENIHKKYLLLQQEKVSSQITLCRQLSAKLERVSSQVRDVNLYLREQEIEEFKMNLAATVIQKHVRGFLTRKHIEPLVIEFKLKKTQTKISKIIAREKYFLYNVGRMPMKSAITIQRAFRRYLFKCKLDRLSTTYHVYMINKEEANYVKLKYHLYRLCLFRISKDKRFVVYKNRKLEEIKHKIALRKIKHILKFHHIKLNSIIEKIKKYKRILRAIVKKKTRKRLRLIEEYTGNPEDIGKMREFDIENISVDSKEEIETTTSDREALERERLLKQLMEERQVKISLGKIAYNLKDPKIPKHMTLLNGKEVPEIKAQIVLANLKDVKLKPPRPIKLRLSKEEFNDEPGYMRSTLSFSNSKSPTFDEKKRASPKKLKGFDMLGLTSILEPTTSYLQKVHKRSISSEKHKASLLRSSFDISPQWRTIQDRTSPIRKTVEMHKKPSDFSLSPRLPEISTHYNRLPSKVKARVDLMKGFAKARAIPQTFFN